MPQTVACGRATGDPESALPAGDPVRYCCGGSRGGNIVGGAVVRRVPVAAIVLLHVRGLWPAVGTAAAFTVGTLAGGLQAANPRPAGVTTMTRHPGQGLLACGPCIDVAISLTIAS